MTDAAALRAPFPWFGGKSKVAAQVWAALGDVDNYVEPFAGSLAVLLGRPQTHAGATETVNDADQYIANFWRALSDAPAAVARYADWPVNEADLFSRHLWLVNEGKRRMVEGMEADPEWYDAQIAGWWVWGQCAWIGSGWCSGNGRGVNRQLPHLGDAGQGVNRQLLRENGLYDYMDALAARLRRVRVCCGDWSRVVTNGALSYGASVGVFLDPPYSLAAGRSDGLYAVDDLSVAVDVCAWCIANGDNPRLRIVLAGYEQEHAMPATWRMVAYSANKSYGGARLDNPNSVNRHLERLWFSPACLNPNPTLFDVISGPEES